MQYIITSIILPRARYSLIFSQQKQVSHRYRTLLENYSGDLLECVYIFHLLKLCY